MKVVFNKEAVFSGLQNAISIMPSKTGAAFLRSVWIVAKNNTITFQSTDANIEFTGSYGADVIEPGMVGVQGQIFYGLINNLGDQIELSNSENENTLYMNHKNGVCKLPTVNSSWFQELTAFPEENSMQWTGDILQSAINKVTYCIDEESAIEALSCLLIKPSDEGNGKIEICGLNGHQFGMFTFFNEEMVSRLPSEGLLIQKSYLPQIAKWLDKNEIYLNFDDKRVFFKNIANEVLSIPRVLYQYPDYNNFLSKLNDDSVSLLELHRADIKGALNRIITINTDIKNCTDFYISENKNMIDCNAKGESSGEVSEKFEVKYNGSIRKITFRTKDLLTIFDHFTSDLIKMKLTTEEGPCSLEGDDDPSYLVVIMPIKTLESSYDREESVN